MKVENLLKENVMGHFCLTFYKSWESAKIHFKIAASARLPPKDNMDLKKTEGMPNLATHQKPITSTTTHKIKIINWCS